MVALASPLLEPTAATVTVSRETVVVAEDHELTRQIELQTFRQVKQLQVRRDGEAIVLAGWSPSYYVKQLATHAALQLAPNTRIENTIRVSRVG